MTPSPAAPPMTPLHAGARITIIGGGATGMLIAAHLLSKDTAQFHVTLIEGRFEPGRGLAYSTRDPDHLLNTRVMQMSAWPEAPEHLLTWLRARPETSDKGPQDFISRCLYGDYLTELASPWKDSGRLEIIADQALHLSEDGLSVTLASGRVVTADLTVLATGHALPESNPDDPVTGAWDFRAPADQEAQVVIIGTGLSMVDQALSLLNKGHRGPILAVSRRGLLPLAHAPSQPLKLVPEDLPLDQGVSQLLRFLRAKARAAEAAGGTWRDVVDAIRPFIAKIWQAWPEAERRRFLRHGSSWWEVHRHRIPDASDLRLRQAMKDGQLSILRAGFQSAGRAGDGSLTATLRPRGSGVLTEVPAAFIVDCRGIRRDPVAHASPVLADLFARGFARKDPLSIGPDVTTDGRLITQSGALMPGVVALGPPTRAALWEITAIPDIRAQAAALAAALAPA
ncbi:FAD/NAD(P)-binding protein [Falsigemmobacter faecalis]|uniref:FAD-dependent urate hydroxylase HpyO/Asp monooxygenase CreE-like FAD/NAD(P)-binding domain-containing protein n=1 Tax=Falsigemmobacter faecalis TaxID=2488730 RepID=A0A3P3DUF6_9RHOB|nr:FAD/NAD(P)-binding protein [Falsigemmobacter faecalis]RRH77917.1 hypothetical protein EG244_02520 [Falsigemmobacter faecalis]